MLQGRVLCDTVNEPTLQRSARLRLLQAAQCLFLLLAGCLTCSVAHSFMWPAGCLVCSCVAAAAASVFSGLTKTAAAAAAGVLCSRC